MLGLCLTLLLTGTSWSAEGALTITKEPENPTYVPKGGTIVFKWDYSADNRTTELQEIVWKVLHTDGRTYPLLIEDSAGKVEVSRRIPQAYKNRVEIIDRATLVVKNASFDDSTKFTFVLEGILGVASSKESAIDLFVTGPAVCTPQVQFAKVGTDVTFTCNATNVPSKSFTWDNPKQTASSDSQYSNTSVTGSSQVTIKSISASDFGYHVCNATVNPDQPNSCKVFLQLPKDSVEVKGEEPCPKRSYTPCIGDNQTICCPIKIGYPPPIVTWVKNGIQLQKGEITEYTITSVEDKDFGNYTCTATNFETTIGPLIVDVKKCAEISLKCIDGTAEQPAKLEWSPMVGAKYYVPKIAGVDVRDDLVIGVTSSLEIHYHALVMKEAGEKPETTEINVYLSAVGDEGVLAKAACEKLTVKKPSDVEV